MWMEGGEGGVFSVLQRATRVLCWGVYVHTYTQVTDTGLVGHWLDTGWASRSS
jgi:hypothetical protein